VTDKLCRAIRGMLYVVSYSSSLLNDVRFNMVIWSDKHIIILKYYNSSQFNTIWYGCSWSSCVCHFIY